MQGETVVASRDASGSAKLSIRSHWIVRTYGIVVSLPSLLVLIWANPATIAGAAALLIYATYLVMFTRLTVDSSGIRIPTLVGSKKVPMSDVKGIGVSPGFAALSASGWATIEVFGKNYQPEVAILNAGRPEHIAQFLDEVEREFSLPSPSGDDPLFGLARALPSLRSKPAHSAWVTNQWLQAIGLIGFGIATLWAAAVGDIPENVDTWAFVGAVCLILGTSLFVHRVRKARGKSFNWDAEWRKTIARREQSSISG